MPLSDLGKKYILRSVRAELEHLFENLRWRTGSTEQDQKQFLLEVQRQLERHLDELEEPRSLEARR